MKHILLIDPLEKLVIKKDSSLLLALALQKLGQETYLLFSDNFHVSNTEELEYNCYQFEGSIEDGLITNFKLSEPKLIEIIENDCIHMRLDPPFDGRYLHTLWWLSILEHRKIKVLNQTQGILKHNEKVLAFNHGDPKLKTFLGKSIKDAKRVINNWKKQGETEFILKPLDLYQGIGVTKINTADSNWEDQLKNDLKNIGESYVLQPFIKSVYDGEIRSVYFKGIELGSIIKIPRKGSYLANIAQGAEYHQIKLTEHQQKLCESITKDLLKDGIDWVAFDILGDYISEVNITCPGLLVELSKACKKDFALEIARMICDDL